MLRLADHWVWDMWFADDGARFHMFFLRASRALKDPGRRHHRAAIGHAVSDDLTNWEIMPDALVHGDAPAPDDLATWTGSVVRDPAGGWHMFYTGVRGDEDGLIQRVCHATSPDLIDWHPDPGFALSADSRWYETLDRSIWHDQAWRDPWVFRNGSSWHMLITARVADGEPDTRGVVGYATSDDLLDWQVQPPLSAPSSFGQLEVMQVVEVDGRHFLLFCVAPDEVAADRRATTPYDGTYAATADGPLGPFHIDDARLIHVPHLYSGRLVQDRSGAWKLIGFVNGGDTRFGGYITDPIDVGVSEDGDLVAVLEERTEHAL
jgi:beta-fructofuranosidase